jgi:hypothetical protein
MAYRLPKLITSLLSYGLKNSQSIENGSTEMSSFASDEWLYKEHKFPDLPLECDLASSPLK